MNRIAIQLIIYSKEVAGYLQNAVRGWDARYVEADKNTARLGPLNKTARACKLQQKKITELKSPPSMCQTNACLHDSMHVWRYMHSSNGFLLLHARLRLRCTTLRLRV